jgi:hypothetical protein
MKPAEAWAVSLLPGISIADPAPATVIVPVPVPPSSALRPPCGPAKSAPPASIVTRPPSTTSNAPVPARPTVRIEEIAPSAIASAVGRETRVSSGPAPGAVTAPSLPTLHLIAADEAAGPLAAADVGVEVPDLGALIDAEDAVAPPHPRH